MRQRERPVSSLCEGEIVRCVSSLTRHEVDSTCDSNALRSEQLLAGRKMTRAEREDRERVEGTALSLAWAALDEVLLAALGKVLWFSSSSSSSSSLVRLFLIHPSSGDQELTEGDSEVMKDRSAVLP